MATVTAQILIGHAHQNHGGIIPTHELYLEENSIPAWKMITINKAEKPITWIPTVEHMLEDALLMASVNTF